jgi:hypothetical protein
MNGRFDLDFDAAWTPEGIRYLRMPFTLHTPEAAWAYGLSVPIVMIDESTALRSARLKLAFEGIRGRVRIGITSGDGSRFVSDRLVDHGTSGEIGLPVFSLNPDVSALVVQNLSQVGASQFGLRSAEWHTYPAERVAALNRYMQQGFNVTEGWCHYLNIAFLRALDEVLFAYGIDGSICEIGIHHGKQFIALHNLLAKGAKSIAIDVFGNQELNLDGSGFGDYVQFQNNLTQWGVRVENCMILQRDSLSLHDQELHSLVRETGFVKFFGVDGCHEVEHTLADLRTAIKMTTQGGVIVLDDYLNPDFPGVHQAVAYLFLNDRPGIAPFATGQNKLYLTQVSHHERYLRHARKIMENIPETDTVREVNLYGYRALSWRTSDNGWAFPEGRKEAYAPAEPAR